MSPELVARAHQLLGQLQTQFPLKKATYLEWRNYRTTAGMANYTTNAIQLSSQILTTEERLDSTLKHEYAHLLAFSRAGLKGRGHGSHWQKAMADLGEPPEVRHRYECERNQARQQVLYKCTKCEVVLVRRRRLPRKRKYLHINCGGAIQFLRIEAVFESSE